MKKLILLIFVVAASLNAQAVQGQIGQVPVVAAADNSPVGGAGNLTTVGSVPYVSASGILNQDAGQLHWDATNNRLGIGTGTPATTLQVAGGKILLDNAQGIQFKDSAGTARTILQVDAGDNVYLDSSATGGDMFFRASGVDKMTIKGTSGNVGIGTTTPGNKLTVVGSGAVIRTTGTNDTSAVYTQFNSSASTGLGYAGVEGSTPGSTLTGTLAYATFISAGSSGSALQLGTPGGIRATILASGNVGIGTTTPVSKLDITDTSNANLPIVSIRNTSVNGYSPQLNFDTYGYSGTPAAMFSVLNVVASYAGAGGAAVSFNTKLQPQSTAVTAMTILGGGNVGIGTTAPGLALDVLGSARVYSSTADAAILFGSDQVDANSGKISYNRGTANLDITPRSTYATNLIGKLKFSITNSTGAGSALLGANSPATTLTAPYTWITVTTSDGSTGYMPIWK